MNIITYGLDGQRKPFYMTPERDAFLRENSFIDPAIIAAEWKIHERWVVRYLRHLGLRKCKQSRWTPEKAEAAKDRKR